MDLFTGEEADTLLRLTVLLRLAVVLRRSRNNDELPDIRLKASGSTLQLRLPGEWLNQHPLTRLDLEQETGFLTQTPVALEVTET
jgi:exopolyphosphatase/guanosine-5'-triphosphate,3'-diphosphate pyrophosphatase